MVTTGSSTSAPDPGQDIPWGNVARFVRQLSHDLRNHLNAAELQSAYVGEIATDQEIKNEVKRLRGMLGELGTILQKLAADMAPAHPNLMPYRAADFLEDLRRKMESTAKQQAVPVIAWDVQVGAAVVELDPQLSIVVMQELLTNAARFGSENAVTVQATIDATKSLVLTLIEPKESFESATAAWGREPLRHVSQGHYGLGLNRARMIVESQGGRFETHYDQAGKNLRTTITLPERAGAAESASREHSK